MAIPSLPAKKGSHIPPSRIPDDDGFDIAFDPDVIRLLQENARLRKLITWLLPCAEAGRQSEVGG
jgi:hypothetical protein